MKKSISIIYLLLVFALLGCNQSKYALDENRMAVYDEIADQVLSETLQNLEIGKSNFVKSDGLDIWYEFIESNADEVRGTVVLIEGVGSSAMGWPDYFYQPILDNGYNVIRFDNREVGRSSWTKGMDYDLSDMAKDILMVIDQVGLDSVHILGQSMGGMIAQEFALNYPARVQTLTLVYTSAHYEDKALPEPTNDLWRKLMAVFRAYYKDDIASKIKLELALSDVLSVIPLEQEDLLFVAKRVRYEYKIRKGVNPKALDDQGKAVSKSGSRYERLNQLSMPTLIIHGEKDPLIDIEHGKKLATLIPFANTLWVPECGHHLTKGFSEIILEELIEMIN